MSILLLLGNQRYDVTSDDPTGVRTLLEATATTFSFINREGTATTLVGSGFTYGADAADGPRTGTIARVDVTAEGGSGAVALRIIGSLGVADLPADFLVSSDAFFGTLLAEGDVLNVSGGANQPLRFGASSLIAGDGIVAEGRLFAAADTFVVGATAGQFSGDTVFVDSDATLRGGNDTMRAVSATLTGDAEVVRSDGTLVGGDDVLELLGAGVVAGDTFRMIFGGRLFGGDDTIDVGGGSTVYGDARDVDDFGDALFLRGGRDTITVNGALGATVFADIDQMILERQLPGTSQIVFGSDNVTGGDGDDTIYGDVRFAATSVLTTLGNDVIRGGAGDDTIYADVGELGSGTSALLFRGGNDLVLAGDGDDLVFGFVGADRLFGQGGADVLMGESGNDRLFGNAGDDVLDGGVGDDLLYGQQGNDVLDGGEGRDLLDGGAGFDTASYATADAPVRVDLLAPGTNTGAAADDTLRSIEGAIGTAGADVLLGTNLGNVLEGGGGDDVLVGRGGNDALRGGAGVDRLFGQAGNDVLNGGAGGDILVGGDQIDAASYASATEGVLADLVARARNTGDAAGDVYVGIENLFGSSGSDRLYGTDARNVMLGDTGADLLVGRGGNDFLDGGDDGDILDGGAGDDVIIGGAGGDRMFGGAGSDRFVYRTLGDDRGGGFDSIVDFRRGEDVIDLRAIDADTTLAGNQAFRFVGSTLTGNAGDLAFNDGVLGADVDGDRTIDFLVFVQVGTLNASDFLL